MVRKLKEEKAPENDVKKALADLKAAKKILEDKVCYKSTFGTTSSI